MIASLAMPLAFGMRVLSVAITASLAAYFPLSGTSASEIKGWSAKTEDGGNACLLTYLTDSVSLQFYRDTYAADAYIVVPHADLPDEFKFTWSNDTGSDRRLTAYIYEEYEGHKFRDDGDVSIDDLLLELEPSSRLTVSITKGVVRVIVLQTFAKAFADYRKCTSQFPSREAAPSEHASELKQDEKDADEPVGLTERLEAMSTKVVGEFICEVSGSELLGVPDISGKDQSNSVTLTVFANGGATYDGRPLVLKTNKKAADGTFEFVTYDVRQILKATAPDPNAPPVAGLNDQEMSEYSAFLGAGNAMMQMVLGNRSRLLFVSLTDNRVIFLDHQNGSNVSNERAPHCYRTH